MCCPFPRGLFHILLIKYSFVLVKFVLISKEVVEYIISIALLLFLLLHCVHPRGPLSNIMATISQTQYEEDRWPVIQTTT